MTAELWLKKPCVHGKTMAHDYGDPSEPNWCTGFSEVRLHPEMTCLFQPDPNLVGETIVYLDVKDVIASVLDLLEEE